MGHKIFVSYKYADSDVQPFYWGRTAYVHDYVSYMENYLLRKDVYKGEQQGEDLSRKGEPYIEAHLKNKIYDSSITIVLISPNMRNPLLLQKDQWIPWEISYSLRLTTRDDRTSQRNALLAVVLPNRYGLYSYYNPMNLFPILRYHIEVNYAYLTKWDDFCKMPQFYIDQAIKNKQNNYQKAAPTLNN